MGKANLNQLIHSICTWQTMPNYKNFQPRPPLRPHHAPPRLSLWVFENKVAVGFKDRVRIYSVLMEGLRVMRDIPQKNCRAVAYAHGGHLLAVASGFSVVVYTAITVQQVG